MMVTQHCECTNGAFYHMYVTSLVAQSIKNLSAMQETGIQSPRWEDPLKKGMATHGSILA